MNTTDYVIIAVVAVILGLAVFYICRSKKKGKKCIGCPEGGNCFGGCIGCTYGNVIK